MTSRGGSTIQKVLVELWCPFALTLLVLNVGFDFLFFTPILYLFVRPFSNGGPVFSFFTNWLMHWVTPSIIGPAFSWGRMRIYLDNLEGFRKASKKNILVLSNHGSRVDWLVARFLGFADPPMCRVNFVVESFLKFMPAIGWHCYWICEDIFVERSFQRDSEVISKRVRNMRRAGHPCQLFLAPEGMIVDTTSKRNSIGKLYLENCRNFCKEQGYPKFDYVLTPRYKGISVLKEHTEAVGGTILSVTMAFTRDGKMLNQGLDSPEREIPDLYAVYAGMISSPIHVYVHTKKISLSDDPMEIKKIMMGDYARKDKLLKYFDEHGCFPDEGFTYEEVKVPHLLLNVFHLLHTLAVIWIMDVLHLRYIVKYGICAMLISLFCCNTLGRIIFGYSIESVPFETGIKPLVHLYYELFNKKLKKAKAAGSAPKAS
jgi:1-acyl-sn-glycerol-3-phosphate acyltransferase